jgi:hypothetical protein
MAPSRQRAIVCDASTLDADLATVDMLAGLALAARRLGMPLLVRQASDDLRALLALTGLAGALGVEPLRQAEQRKQPPGVQEERQLGDGPARQLDDL